MQSTSGEAVAGQTRGWFEHRSLDYRSTESRWLVPQRDIVVVGTSAGGIVTLQTVLSALPLHFPASIFVVMHTAENSPGVLPSVLNRSSALPVLYASHHMPIYPGRVYVAPPSLHLKLTRGQVELGTGARENRHRPSVDVLFRSAANAYGSRVIGVVLSGYLNDGSMGLQYVKKHGGVAIVQDPNDAIASSMPLEALEKSDADYVLPASEIGAKLVSLVGRSGPQLQVSTGNKKEPAKVPAGERETPAEYSCPDCGGVLRETSEGGLMRYVCRVGHGYAPEALLEAQWDYIEGALWAGIRSLEEHADFSDRMAQRLPGKEIADRLLERAERARDNARILHELIEKQTAESSEIAEESTGT